MSRRGDVSSPDFFDLLPDGFGQSEMFLLDVFHRNCSPITAVQLHEDTLCLYTVHMRE